MRVGLRSIYQPHQIQQGFVEVIGHNVYYTRFKLRLSKIMICVLCTHMVTVMGASETDVLIAGAGPAGLVLAIELARRGIGFRLIEKTKMAAIGSRGRGISPRSQEIFEDLGTLEGLIAVGGRYPPIHIYDGNKVVSRQLNDERASSPREPYANALMVAQTQTEAVLRGRLAVLGHPVFFGIELIGFEQTAHAVQAKVETITGEETIRARYLVGTDGGRSFVRQTLGIGFAGNTLPICALFGDLEIDNLSTEAWHRWPTAMGGQLSLSPIAQSNAFQMAAQISSGERPDTSDAALQALIAERTGRADLRIRTPTWLSLYQVNIRLAEHYRAGRVLIAGDAAHVHPPTGGQGLNTSIQDSYNLGWKLASVLNGAPNSLLDTYEAERRPIGADVIELSMGLLRAMGEGQMQRGRDVQQLDLNYRGSQLARELRQNPGQLQAGDHVSDARLLERGNPIRLFDVLQGPHLTLLGYDVPEDALRAFRDFRQMTTKSVTHSKSTRSADLIDFDDQFRDGHGLSAGTFVLIRPDGYVGLMADATDKNAVSEYLRNLTHLNSSN